MYTLKLILVLNLSSLALFSFSSAVNSCYQLLTADDSCYEKKLNGIFIYSLKLISIPNFSSPGCLGAKLESVLVILFQAKSVLVFVHYCKIVYQFSLCKQTFICLVVVRTEKFYCYMCFLSTNVYDESGHRVLLFRF